MSMPPQKTLQAESTSVSLTSSRSPACETSPAISRSIASLRRLCSGRLRVIFATPLSMRNFTCSNCSGLRRSGCDVKSWVSTGSIISRAPGLACSSELRKWKKVAEPDASTVCCDINDEWSAWCANSSQTSGTGFMGKAMKLLQGKMLAPFSSFFLCIFGQWLFCELPQSWSAREHSRQSTKMSQYDALSKQRTAIAVRMLELLDADGFPSSSSCEVSGPLRFNADSQGKNADPERETEVRLLGTPEAIFVRFQAKNRSITVFPNAEPSGRRD